MANSVKRSYPPFYIPLLLLAAILLFIPPALSGFHFNELTEDLSCLHDHQILEWTLSMESPRDFQEGTWEAATIAALHSIRQTPPIEGQFGAVKSEA